MNILDIAENSLSAGAKLVRVTISENRAENRLTLTIADDGKGMDADMLRRVCDPFTTTRTTRKVGLGLPFLKMAAQQTGGDLVIESTLGAGTTVCATFTLGHIDLMPLGDVGGSLAALVQSRDDIDFIFTCEVRDEGAAEPRAFVFSTPDARAVLGGVPLSEPAVAVFIKDAVNEGVREVLGPPQ